MTQKELLYVEDAIEHECVLVKVLEESKEKLEDQSLIEFVDSEIEKHNSIKENLMNLLEEKANE